MPRVVKKLWKYTNQRMTKNESRDYYAVSIPRQYYDEFLGKDLMITQNGSSIVITVSGCPL